jgi:hypothetical protein
MDDLAKTLAELERRRDDCRSQARHLWAEATGLDAQIEALRAGLQPVDAFEALSLTDAVEQVLRAADAAMTPAHIHAQLQARGRKDELRSLGGTLQHLKHAGRVTKAGRGQWLATT